MNYLNRLPGGKTPRAPGAIRTQSLIHIIRMAGILLSLKPKWLRYLGLGSRKNPARLKHGGAFQFQFVSFSASLRIYVLTVSYRSLTGSSIPWSDEAQLAADFTLGDFCIVSGLGAKPVPVGKSKKAA